MGRKLYIIGLLGLAALGSHHLRAQSPGLAAQQARTDAILQRLLATPAAQHHPGFYRQWPPTATVVESSQVGAYAAADNCRPTINLSSALVVQIVGQDDARLAFVLGHELSHILLGHTQCQAAGDSGATMELGHLAFSREQEFAADKSGLALALAAGYPYDHCMSLFKALLAVAPDAPLDAQAEDHPAIAERSGQLQTDAVQQMLWRNMGAFADGVSLLVSQQYGLAVSAFAGVTRQFPQAYDAWNNQGYARLMEYADLLRPADVAQMHLGQVATGGFYRQAGSLEAQLRGRNTEQWTEAVADLQRAAQLQPHSELIQGNLGLAYALAPDDAAVAQAPAFLQQALTLAAGTAGAVARDNLNLAVAQLRLNQAASAARAMAAVQSACGATGSDDDPCAGLRPALLYDQWMAAALAGAPPSPDQLNQLTQYLGEESHDSAWWQIAFANYQNLARQLHATPQGATDFPQPESFRRVSNVPVGTNTISIGDAMHAAQAELGPGTLLPAAPGTPLQRICYPDRGMDLIGGDTVVAILLYGDHAPTLQLQHAGLTAASGLAVRVGASQNPLLPLFGPDPQAVTMTAGGPQYRLLAGTGLAVAVDNSGTLQQVLVMALPNDSSPSME